MYARVPFGILEVEYLSREVLEHVRIHNVVHQTLVEFSVLGELVLVELNRPLIHAVVSESAAEARCEELVPS